MTDFWNAKLVVAAAINDRSALVTGRSLIRRQKQNSGERTVSSILRRFEQNWNRTADSEIVPCGFNLFGSIKVSIRHRPLPASCLRSSAETTAVHSQICKPICRRNSGIGCSSDGDPVPLESSPAMDDAVIAFVKCFYYHGNMKDGSIVRALAALAQETRLGIFRLLVQAGDEGISAGVLAERLGVANATLSFHLKELANSGLIGARQESRHIYYSANYAAMNTLLQYLTENCCQGVPCLPEASCCEPEKEPR